MGRQTRQFQQILDRYENAVGIEILPSEFEKYSIEELSVILEELKRSILRTIGNKRTGSHVHGVSKEQQNHRHRIMAKERRIAIICREIGHVLSIKKLRHRLTELGDTDEPLPEIEFDKGFEIAPPYVSCTVITMSKYIYPATMYAAEKAIVEHHGANQINASIPTAPQPTITRSLPSSSNPPHHIGVFTSTAVIIRGSTLQQTTADRTDQYHG